MSVGTETIPYAGRTAWARNVAAPVRSFLSTESGGAIVMLAAAIAALLWANSPGWHSYEAVWTTRLSIQIGSAGNADGRIRGADRPGRRGASLGARDPADQPAQLADR